MPSLAPFELPPGTRVLHVGTLGLVLEPMAATIEQLIASMPGDVALVVDVNHRPAAIADHEDLPRPTVADPRRAPTS